MLLPTSGLFETDTCLFTLNYDGAARAKVCAAFFIPAKAHNSDIDLDGLFAAQHAG